MAVRPEVELATWVCVGWRIGSQAISAIVVRRTTPQRPTFLCRLAVAIRALCSSAGGQFNSCRPWLRGGSSLARLGARAGYHGAAPPAPAWTRVGGQIGRAHV